MESILQVVVAVPLDDVCEQVTKECGVVGKQHLEIKRLLRGRQLRQLDLAGRQVAPISNRELVCGVGMAFAYLLENHGLSIFRNLTGITLNTRRFTYSGVVS